MAKGTRQRARNVTHLREGCFQAAMVKGDGSWARSWPGKEGAAVHGAPAQGCSSGFSLAPPYKKAEKGGRGGHPRFRKRKGEESASWKSQVGNPGWLEGPELPVLTLQHLLQMLPLISGQWTF